MSAAATEAASAQTKLLKLTRRRLEKYSTLLPKVLITDDPEAVHDLRVWSRRLQQALRVVASPTQSKKINKIFADLRYVRQVLGPCRDLDVNIALVKSKGERCGNASVENAWGSMQRALESQRQPLIERVRRDIASQDLFKFVIRVQRLIDAVERDFDPRRGSYRRHGKVHEPVGGVVRSDAGTAGCRGIACPAHRRQKAALPCRAIIRARPIKSETVGHITQRNSDHPW